LGLNAVRAAVEQAVNGVTNTTWALIQFPISMYLGSFCLHIGSLILFPGFDGSFDEEGTLL
jgi:hypothetical protein